MSDAAPIDRAIATSIRRIDESQLRRHVEAIVAAGPRSVDDPQAVCDAIAYLKDELSRQGYEPVEEPFGSEAHEVNVIAEHRGTAEPDVIFELGAHYDTVRGSPGADDNASAVAGLLEIARLVAGVSCRRTIRMCFFGAEESGLRGSRGHVARLEADPDQRVEGIAVFEMIGYCDRRPGSQRTPVRIPLVIWPPRTGDFITLVSNFASRSIATRLQRAANRYVPQLRVYAVKHLGGLIRDAARSDHKPYWRAGRRGVMITDTANFRNPNYHQPTDTPDTLDYAFMAHVTRATAAMVLQWSGLQVDAGRG